MATLILTAAVSAIGLTGWTAIAAQLAATAVGAYIDSQLVSAFAPKTQSEGPRLQEIQITNSTEGSPIKKIWGRSRTGGSMIWCTNFEEVTNTEEVGGGGIGKGMGGGAENTTYTYYISFAVAFGEGGSGTELDRVWFDGDVIDISLYTTRFYVGDTSQGPDSLIQQIEGSDRTPGFRGVCYLVFERLPLADFGNRVPQVTAEIRRPIFNNDANRMENLIPGLVLIPGTGEFALSTTPTVRMSDNNTVGENTHFQKNRTDIEISMDQIDRDMPHIETVSVAVSWFCSDLRAGDAQVKPKIETRRKLSLPNLWQVDGILRQNADELPTYNGGPVFGGTPSDNSVVECIQRLQGRGKRVAFYPLVLCDIMNGNSLPNPYGGTGQPQVPWRGWITCYPAIGQPGSPDQTATAGSQIDAFFGSASAGDFNISGTQVSWTGSPTEFGYRRYILHYAHLCAALGGVNYFVVGSELVGLTKVRSNSFNFSGVAQISALISDVKAILPGAEVSYAADWSEYHSYRPTGTNDVFFNMDTIWANPDCAFIGIDNYMPISDWRDGTDHLDYDENGPRKIYDRDYLRSNIEGGEYYDWFYASDADRNSQTRSPITDGAYGKPWVFRNKDIYNWWHNPHYHRVGGVEAGAPTSWSAESKRVIFTEFGCPAIDKGTNQPNVFYDPKSVMSATPYFSNSNRDDMIQRAYVEAVLTYWRDNPIHSGAYAGLMIETDDMWLWAWDARPYPFFPLYDSVWSDGGNWTFGHWINGRANAITLQDLVREFFKYVGLENDIDVSELVGPNTFVSGYVVDNIMSPREMLSPLFQAYLFDAYESLGKIIFKMKSDTKFVEISKDNFVTDDKNLGGYTITRQMETELPDAALVDFMDMTNSYQAASTSGLKQTGDSSNVINLKFPLVLDQTYCRGLADIVVQESWVGRETGEFSLPYSYIWLDPADGVWFEANTRVMQTRLLAVEMAEQLNMSFITHDPTIYDFNSFQGRPSRGQPSASYGQDLVVFLDIPLLLGSESRPWAPRVVAYAKPFPSTVRVYIEDPVTSALTLLNQLQVPSQVGAISTALDTATPWTINEQTVQVRVFNSAFQPLSNSESAVLAGENALAVQNDDGNWEILQFVDCTLISGNTYELSRLIRGQLGTEADMAPISVDARVVFLNNSLLIPLALNQGQRSMEFIYRYGPSVDEPSEPTYQTETLSFRSVGLMPYAPSGLTAVRTNVDGRLQLSWKRRTRFGGDDWGTTEPAINEESELYDLEICDLGGTVLRTVASLTSPTYLYSAADQVTDFGTVQTSVRIRVYQRSAVVGRGHKVDEVVSF